MSRMYWFQVHLDLKYVFKTIKGSIAPSIDILSEVFRNKSFW